MTKTPRVDGGSFVGTILETGERHTIDQVLSDWDRLGFTHGIVGSLKAIYYDVKGGNAEMVELARSSPRIVPLAIVHPSYFGESPQELLGWLHQRLKFRVIGVFSAPAYYSVNWASPVIKKIGEAASRLGMVLQAGIQNEQELMQVAESWGRLSTPVMIRWMSGHRYSRLATELSIAKICKNFLFDVGNATSVTTLSLLHEKLGTKRLFVATNAPHQIAQCSMSVLSEASIDMADLFKILKIKRSVKAARVTSLFESVEWRSLKEAPKVDVHWHPDHWNNGEGLLSARTSCKLMDAYHYERVIQFSVLALNYDLTAGNELTRAGMEKDSRIYGLIVVNPLRIEESLKQIEIFGGDSRFVGLKTIQDAYGIPLSDPRYEILLKAAAKWNLPILAHLPGIREAALAHPKVRFIAAHANFARAAHLAGIPNLYFDFATSNAFAAENRMGEFIRAVGADHVMFGSDSQLMHPAWSLSKLLGLGLSERELRQILRENAYHVFPKLG